MHVAVHFGCIAVDGIASFRPLPTPKQPDSNANANDEPDAVDVAVVLVVANGLVPNPIAVAKHPLSATVEANATAPQACAATNAPPKAKMPSTFAPNEKPSQQDLYAPSDSASDHQGV
jgi:hypothetical protein